MPIIRVEMFPGRSFEMKQALADRFIEAFRDVCGSAPSDVAVLFSHVSPHDWFVAGNSYAGPPAGPKSTDN